MSLDKRDGTGQRMRWGGVEMQMPLDVVLNPFSSFDVDPWLCRVYKSDDDENDSKMVRFREATHRKSLAWVIGEGRCG